jgi:hypothetical protein
MNGVVGSQREALENALAALVRVEYLHPITRIRVRQARDRSGLVSLLEPALSEMDEMVKSVSCAKREVVHALAQLVGSDDAHDE